MIPGSSLVLTRIDGSFDRMQVMLLHDLRSYCVSLISTSVVLAKSFKNRRRYSNKRIGAVHI